MILIREVVYALLLLHFYKMENVFNVAIHIFGIFEQILALNVHKHIYSVFKAKDVYAHKNTLINITESVFLVIIHIIGTKLLKCVFHAQKLTNLIQKQEDVNVHKNYLMILDINALHVLNLNIGINKLNFVNNVLLILIIQKINKNVLHAHL